MILQLEGKEPFEGKNTIFNACDAAEARKDATQLGQCFWSFQQSDLKQMPHLKQDAIYLSSLFEMPNVFFISRSQSQY